MIKNLLNADEDPPPGTKVIIEETVVDPPVENSAPAIPATSAAPPETPPRDEVPGEAQIFTEPSDEKPSPESFEESAATLKEPPAPLDQDAESLSALMADIENLDERDLDALENRLESAAARDQSVGKRINETETAQTTDVEAGQPPLAAPAETSIPAEAVSENPPVTEPFEPPRPPVDAMPTAGTLFQTEEAPRQSMGETIRQSGLAYSAAIVLVGSVVFTMILGWFADLLLGSSPWGIVGGIVIGGIIGFIQFFRITSQIFRK